MNFKGPAFPLQDGDISIIAGYLGCHIAAVRAVLIVEAANKGFDSQGRPKMLFEPHIFWRELGPSRKRNNAIQAGLAYPDWIRDYPADSYPRLIAAMAINETAALRSASWGLGQVMGFNHKSAGFDTVQQFVRAMTYSEGAHLYAMARFIVSNRLQRHLREQNWSSFARGYNGAGYAAHGYHTRLAAAYAGRPSCGEGHATASQRGAAKPDAGSGGAPGSGAQARVRKAIVDRRHHRGHQGPFRQRLSSVADIPVVLISLTVAAAAFGYLVYRVAREDVAVALMMVLLAIGVLIGMFKQ